MERWLIIVENDLEPDAIGPFPTDDERDRVARDHKAARGDEDGIFGLDIHKDGRLRCVPTIWAYSSGFFEGA